MKGAVSAVRCSRVPPLLWIPAGGKSGAVDATSGEEVDSWVSNIAMPFSVPTVTKDIILRPTPHSA